MSDDTIEPGFAMRPRGFDDAPHVELPSVRVRVVSLEMAAETIDACAKALELPRLSKAEREATLNALREIAARIRTWSKP